VQLLVIPHTESSVDGHESFQNAKFLVTHGCTYAAVYDWAVEVRSSSSSEHRLVFFIGFPYGKPLSVASFVVLPAVLLWLPVSPDVVSLRK
jgi:hypothetical protein